MDDHLLVYYPRNVKLRNSLLNCNVILINQSISLSMALARLGEVFVAFY